MALEDGGIIPTMPIAPTNNGGFGGFGGGYGNNQLSYDFPWLLNGQNSINANTNNGFRDAMINDGISSIQNSITGGFGDMQTALCGGFAGVNASIANGFATAESSANARQMANMNQAFASQTAMSQGFNGLQDQLADCCCSNKIATIETRNAVANEGAATRLAIQNQTQQIIDKLCEQEIENLRSQNVALQNQVNMLNLSASQATQTAQLIADNTAQTQYLVNRIAPVPIPAYLTTQNAVPATA